MRFVIIVQIVLFFGLMFSCQKAENRECFKSTGKTVIIKRDLDSFSNLRLYQNIDFELIPDSINYVLIEGGENLVNFIAISLENQTLSVKDENHCGFLRDLSKKVKVKIHAKNIRNIYYEGSETLICRDTLKAAYFIYVQQAGGGSADLLIQANYLEMYIHSGVGNFNLGGKCDVLQVGIKGSSYCDLRSMIVRDSIYFEHNSFGDMKLFADVIPLRGVLKNSGNVYCTGNPSLTNVSELFSGKIYYP